MEWKPKNIQHSILPIMVLNWITGLNVLEYPLGKARPVLTFIYTFAINFIYWRVTYAEKMTTSNQHLNLIEIDIFKLLKYFNMFIATFSVLVSWYYYKEFKTNIRRLELLDDTLELLGLLKNYRRTFIKSLLKSVAWIIMIIVLIYFDIYFLMSSIFKDLIRCLHAVYLFHFPLHLNSLVDFTFTTIVHLIGMRFENINLFLKNALPKYSESKTVGNLFTSIKKLNTVLPANEYKMRLRNRHRQIGLITLVRHLHMELSKISVEINNIYQKQMTMEMAAYFFTITGLLYNLFTTIFFHNEPFSKKYKFILSMLLWCVAYSYRFMNINCTCARVSLEARKTRDILYDLKNSSENEELNEEIQQFSLQLTQRPLAFTACGFSTLDYSFVQRFTGTVTTFLVILIQFSPKIVE